MEVYRQVPLQIEHDWSQTKSFIKKLMTLKDSSVVSDYGNSSHYDFKALGTLSEHKLSPSWYRLAGPKVNKTMPWLNSFLESMKELEPDEGCISYMIGSGGEHVDLPHLKSALNYIFESSDSSAHTWLRHGDVVERYPSDLNTAWIINTQVPHGIQNSGERWALSIHFGVEYEKVVEWFSHHPQLFLN